MEISKAIKKESIIKKISFLMISVIYAIYMSSLPSFLFKDRDNYIRYAESGISFFDNKWDLMVFFQEPLFLLMNEWLMFLNDPQLTITIFIFFVCFSMMLFILKKSKNVFFFTIFFSLILANAQTFALQLVTIRQGIGLSILLLYFIYNKKYSSYKLLIFFTVLLGLIHNSFFIVALLLAIDWFLIEIVKIKKNKIRFLFSFLSSLFLNISIFTLTKVFQTKEAYEGVEINVGGGGFLFWSLVLTYIFIFKPKKYTNVFESYFYSLAVTGLILYLTGYFLAPISGRIIGTYIPFIIYILLYKAKSLDVIFVCFLLIIFTYISFNGGYESFLNVSLDDFFYYIF